MSDATPLSAEEQRLRLILETQPNAVDHIDLRDTLALLDAERAASKADNARWARMLEECEAERIDARHYFEDERAAHEVTRQALARSEARRAEFVSCGNAAMGRIRDFCTGCIHQSRGMCEACMLSAFAVATGAWWLTGLSAERLTAMEAEDGAVLVEGAASEARASVAPAPAKCAACGGKRWQRRDAWAGDDGAWVAPDDEDSRDNYTESGTQDCHACTGTGAG